MSIGLRQAGRRLALLTATRWFPVGLTLGLTVLLPLERGLTLAEVGGLMAIAGFVSLALEVPTGGLADILGRRPVLLVAGALAIVSTTVFVLADTAALFAVALVLQGAFRALDSGPLESWFVDTAHAVDPAAHIERDLSRAGAVLGVALGGGALIGGLLVAWHPIDGFSALVLPFLVAIGAQLAHLVLIALLVHEPRRIRVQVEPEGAPEHRAGAVISAAARLLRESSVLRWLVAVEIFWSVGMIGFETLTPVRLAEFVGGEQQAGALFGPAAAAAWALFAAGSALAGLASRRLGVAGTAMVSRALNGVFVIGMGVVAGAAGLVAGFWLAYVTHGANGPMHNTLLHRESDSRTRTLVLSINSMVASGTFSLGLLVLLPLAEIASTGIAFVVAGAFSLVGVVCYLPALRRERSARARQSNFSSRWNGMA